MSHTITGVNDIASQRPDLIEVWDYKLNGEVTPNEISVGSEKKVWWKCENGHSYPMAAYNKVKGSNCPYCSGRLLKTGINDLVTKAPQLAEEWDWENNEGLSPQNVYWKSKQKIAWKCKQGHCWKNSPQSRIYNESNCPYCAGRHLKGFNDLKTRFPELSAEWNFDKNKNLDPDDVTANSSKKVWWKCSKCGNEWQAIVRNRTKGSGCPRCMKYKQTSFPEQAVYYYVQQFFSDAENGYRGLFNDKMELDVYIPSKSIGIEYDGIAWHSNESNYKRDNKKYQKCKNQGIILCRITEFVPKINYSDKLILRLDSSEEELDKAIVELLVWLGVENENIDVNVSRDRNEIMAQYYSAIKNKSIAERYPEAVSEWDVEKNKDISPDMVNCYSNQNFWWRCKLGHSYRATPSNRFAGGDGCPICSGHKVLVGYNDLGTTHPDSLQYWDFNKNTEINPTDITASYTKKVWWKCDNNHSYQSSPQQKILKKVRCPYCSNRELLKGYNDLESNYPDVAKRWDREKNDFYPKDVLYNSRKKVWWKCNEGHSYQRAVNAQLNFDGCPICLDQELLIGFNDVETKYPKLAKQWNYEKNNSNPKNHTRLSKHNVWWKCDRCETEWEASIYNRITGNTGCPTCGYAHKMQATRMRNNIMKGNTLAKKYPELLAEWDFNKNIDDPNAISPGANKKIWWLCEKGHSYQAWLTDRTGKLKTGCPYCAGKRKL